MMIHDVVAAAGDQPCFWLDYACVLKDGAGTLHELPKAVANASMAPIAATFMNAWQQMEMFFLASWIALPLLVDITDPNGTSAWLQDTLSNFTFLFAVLGALVTAGWTFIKLGPEKVKNLGVRLSVLLLISIGGAPIIAALDRGVRIASIWLLTQVGVTSTSTLVNTAAAGISPGITLIIAIIAVIGVMIQWGIMLARGPLVVVLTGIWPLTAAAATLGVKKAEASFERVSSWLFAFIIYPFPAAIVYAAAFRLKSGYDGLGGVIYGFVLEMLAVFLLPSIFRIIAPQTEVLGKAFGGQMAMKAAITVMETAVAVGAAVVTAGAAAGMFASKLAGAGVGAASNSASGGGAATGGGSAAPGGGPGVDPAGGDAPASSGGDGASATNAENPAPAASGAGNSSGSDTSGTGPDNAGPTGATTPAAGGEPSQQSAAGPTGGAEAGRGAQSEKRSSDNMAKFYAGQQAAQAVSGGIGRAARDGMDDADEIIGGKHG